jgi:hypothetical protein
MSRFLLAIVLLAALAPGIADACSNLLLRCTTPAPVIVTF